MPLLTLIPARGCSARESRLLAAGPFCSCCLKVLRHTLLGTTRIHELAFLWYFLALKKGFKGPRLLLPKSIARALWSSCGTYVMATELRHYSPLVCTQPSLMCVAPGAFGFCFFNDVQVPHRASPLETLLAVAFVVVMLGIGQQHGLYLGRTLPCAMVIFPSNLLNDAHGLIVTHRVACQLQDQGA